MLVIMHISVLNNLFTLTIGEKPNKDQLKTARNIRKYLDSSEDDEADQLSIVCYTICSDKSM